MSVHTTVTYIATCPHCGAALSPVAGHHSWAPWLCYACSRGWFVAELVHREGWDRVTASWHHDARRDLEALVHKELHEAHERGSSLRHDQVTILALEVLEALATRWDLSTLASLLATIATATTTGELSVAVMQAETELNTLLAKIGVELELLKLLVAEAQRRAVI